MQYMVVVVVVVVAMVYRPTETGLASTSQHHKEVQSLGELGFGCSVVSALPSRRRAVRWDAATRYPGSAWLRWRRSKPETHFLGDELSLVVWWCAAAAGSDGWWRTFGEVSNLISAFCTAQQLKCVGGRVLHSCTIITVCWLTKGDVRWLHRVFFMSLFFCRIFTVGNGTGEPV